MGFENGPQGGDEVNIIRPGANYGWPEVSYSRQYRGDWVSERKWQSDIVQPEILWWPSIAPAGLAFYTGDKIESWQGDLFVGAMLQGRIPGTGHVERIVFNSRQEYERKPAERSARGSPQSSKGLMVIFMHWLMSNSVPFCGLSDRRPGPSRFPIQ